MKDYKIRCIDSINWFGMSLDKLPKTFGLNLEAGKGMFPHLMNSKQYWNYIGEMPDIKFYAPNNLSTEKREKLINWHREMKESNYVFDFQKEISKYCEQDVNILRLSCLRFRSISLEETGCDPFRYNTLAATSLAIYRSKFLQPNTIAIVPNDLYRGPQKLYSKSCIQWLEFLAYTTKEDIIHAQNEGEYVIQDPELNKTYHVDGKVRNKNLVLEFHGCIFHAHNKCVDSESYNPFKPLITNAQVYRDTLFREERLRALGFQVKIIWECDFVKLTQTHAFKAFINSHELTGPLEPRDAFFGGRTNGLRLFYRCKPGEKIQYVDFTSLYPFCNSRRLYPSKHPVCITTQFKDISNYFGIVKCRVLAPSQLYLPVLPVRINGKLFFPLCKQCGIHQHKICHHSEAERSFWGTWATIEVQKAIELGYKVVEIKEIWHFEETSSNLFKPYVDTFLRSKQESSDYPLHVQTEEQKQPYIDDYYLHEGISLRPERICHNPGLRAISKYALNSLWGRFAMRCDRVQSELVHDVKRFYDIVNGADYDLQDLYIINEDVVELIYHKKTRIH